MNKRNQKKIFFLNQKHTNPIRRLLKIKIKNTRPMEIDGFRETENLTRTLRINQADIIFVRNKPESTTDKQISCLSGLLAKYPNKLIINDIRSFYNYDSKDRSFDIWKRNNLLCPDFIAFNSEELNNEKQCIERTKAFFQTHKRILLRTNNETGSKGLYVINKEGEIANIIPQLIARVRKKSGSARDTRMMCVQYIGKKLNSDYNDLYRVHILGNEILSYYVISSTREHFHCSHVEEKDLGRVIELNSRFAAILPSIKDKLIRAVQSLGSNIGAIEFFLIDNEPCFIELNPMWGGHASRNGIGNEFVQHYFTKEQSELMHKIPNIYNWLDYKNYYKIMYDHIVRLL